jgi:hypothetical protein
MTPPPDELTLMESSCQCPERAGPSYIRFFELTLVSGLNQELPMSLIGPWRYSKVRTVVPIAQDVFFDSSMRLRERSSSSSRFVMRVTTVANFYEYQIDLQLESFARTQLVIRVLFVIDGE